MITSRNFKKTFLTQAAGSSNIYLLPQDAIQANGDGGRSVFPINTPYATVAIAADSEIDCAYVRPDNSRDWYLIGKGQPLPPPPGNQQLWSGPLNLSTDNFVPVSRGSNRRLPTTVLGVAVSADQWRAAFQRCEVEGGTDRPPFTRPQLSVDVYQEWPDWLPSDRAPLVDNGFAATPGSSAETLLHAWVLSGRRRTRISVGYTDVDAANVRLVSLMLEQSHLSGGDIVEQIYPSSGYQTLDPTTPGKTIVIDSDPLHVLALMGSKTGVGSSNVFWKLSSED
ncbi:MAG TPA: hypothetical protein VK510_03130 [Solirubrobacteraceae bacterium]|nr:hypothetical protein [Solirubrobacteraceae bacterium]